MDINKDYDEEDKEKTIESDDFNKNFTSSVQLLPGDILNLNNIEVGKVIDQTSGDNDSKVITIKFIEPKFEGVFSYDEEKLENDEDDWLYGENESTYLYLLKENKKKSQRKIVKENKEKIILTKDQLGNIIKNEISKFLKRGKYKTLDDFLRIQNNFVKSQSGKLFDKK